MALGWAGLYGPMALGAIGSMIGCAQAVPLHVPWQPLPLMLPSRAPDGSAGTDRDQKPLNH